MGKKLNLEESVRKRPGMYFGDIEYNGANTLVYELLDNALDLFLEGCVKEIKVKVFENKISVSDDGGFSNFKQFEKKYGLSNIKKYVSHNRKYRGYSIGLAPINIASKKFKIESSDGEFIWSQVFSKGESLSSVKPKKSNTPKGTTVSLILDNQIFEGNIPNMFELRKRIFDLAHLYQGLRIYLNGELFHSKNGLIDYGYLLANPACYESNLIRTFEFKEIRNEMYISAVAIGSSRNETQYYSWVNDLRTVKNGSHINGFRKALKKSKWDPVIALLHINMPEPQYSGCCKDKIVSDKVSKIVEVALLEGLQQSGETNA